MAALDANLLALVNAIGASFKALRSQLRYERGSYMPSDYGMLGWTGDPAISATLAPATGRQYYVRMKQAVTGPITNINTYVSGAGVAVTHGFFAVYDLSGTKLGQTADQTTSLQSVGAKSFALTAPTASIPAGTEYLISFIGSATTMPTLMATGPSSPGANVGLSATSPWRLGIVAATGLTAPQSPLVLSSSVIQAICPGAMVS